MASDGKPGRDTGEADDGRIALRVSDVDAVPSRRPASDGYDPLVHALAQLVRDRWAVEQAQDETPLALRTRPSNMRTVDGEREPGLERSA